MQIAQEQVLGDVDDRGVATIDSGTGWGVPADPTDRQRDWPRGQVTASKPRGSKGSKVSAICQALSWRTSLRRGPNHVLVEGKVS